MGARVQYLHGPFAGQVVDESEKDDAYIEHLVTTGYAVLAGGPEPVSVEQEEPPAPEPEPEPDPEPEPVDEASG